MSFQREKRGLSGEEKKKETCDVKVARLLSLYMSFHYQVSWPDFSRLTTLISGGILAPLHL